MIRTLLVLLVLCASIARADDAVLVAQLNATNTKIKSLVGDIENVTHKHAFVFSAKGKLYYERDNNFRMTANATTNDQPSSDIGSNKDYFWFWIRKLDPQTMYYCSYRDINNSGITHSVNPMWFIEGLGVANIDTTGAKIYRSGQYVAIVRRIASPQGEDCYKMVYIDPAKPVIAGHRLYSLQKKLLGTADVQDYYSTNVGVYIPKKMSIIWYGEGIHITWTLSNPQINVSIPVDTWKMPKTSFKVMDMGKQKVDWRAYEEK